MPQLTWDKVGERVYEAGVSHGVLYFHGAPGVPWNGITEIDETFNESTTPVYMDGIKYLDSVSLADFAAKLSAITYPEEFEQALGSYAVQNAPGLLAQDQVPIMFGLAFRTQIADDTTDINDAYLLHLCYNLMVVEDAVTHATQSQNVDPNVFSWAISSVAEPVINMRASSHLIIDSREIDATLLGYIESTLYGGEGWDAQLPNLNDTIVAIMNYVPTDPTIFIVDNGDGSFSVTGSSDRVVDNGDGSYTITDVAGTIIDANSFTITTTYT